jgi:hypothetical protein
MDNGKWTCDVDARVQEIVDELTSSRFVA